MVDEKKKCFVITPIGDNNSEIRRHIDGIIDQAVIPAIGEKFEIEVAHRKYEIGSINDRVIRSVYDADLIIANLTNLNPNVMFELAIRYSFGKPAIVIAEEGTKLPFDIVDENTLFYINDPSGANELKEKIIEFERNIDYSKQTYGSVYKAISNIPLYKEVETGKSVSNEKMLSYIIDRLDSLQVSISDVEQRRNVQVMKEPNVIIEVIFDLKSIENEEKFYTEFYDIMNFYKINKSKIEFYGNQFRIYFSGSMRKTDNLCRDLNIFMQKYTTNEYRIEKEYL